MTDVHNRSPSPPDYSSIENQVRPRTAEAHEGAELVRQAAKTWSGQLVDLSARNNLLFYRDLKAGTLNLGDSPPPALFDALAGKTVSLSRLFPDESERANSIKRARVVHNRAQEHFEERGLETLFLACGMATWTNRRGAATPSAPVLMCPARLTPRGAAQDEFELSVTADAEVNQTLLHALDADFECRFDPDSLLASAGIEGAIDTPEELDVAYHWLAEQAARVPGFSVAPQFVLATFAYAKLPMVTDLEGSLEAMVRHELVAALAGDQEAQSAVNARRIPVDITAPNHTPPVDEFLVLDADASQNYTINAVLGGQDTVIKGPPGTGKSQTIANLISSVVAGGKNVLFVAEKRAAIDAVFRRLDDVGLGDLVLDLHGGVGSKREVAQRLAGTLATNAELTKLRLEADHRLLDARRSELNAHVEALHAPREPWDVSVFEAQARTLSPNDSNSQTVVRFRGLDLERLNADAFERARELLRTYAGMGGLTLARSGSPWGSANVVSHEEAQAVQSQVDRLSTVTLPPLLARLHDAARQTGVRSPHTFGGWQDYLTLWEDIERTLRNFKPSLFDRAFDDRLAALTPLAAGVGKRATAALTSAEYRAARKEIKGHLHDGARLRGPALFSAVEAAHDQQRRWHDIAEHGRTPNSPADLEGLRSTLDELTGELDALRERLALDSLDAPEDELLALLDRLRNDTTTLGKLPELHRLRTELHSLGLDELLRDLERRSVSPDACQSALEYAWLTSIMDHVRLTDARIGAFDGEQHGRTLAEFQQADRRHVETTAQRVRRTVAERAVRMEEEQEDQGRLIRDQAARKRKHLPVRQLFAAAPDMMTALKPCWAMSPLVVSQLLPADHPYFDVVIFDEASQVRPAEAIPAILRGKRVAVAGDERQLPPTSFFTGAAPGEDDAMVGRVTVDTGYESILEALLPFISWRTLSWHYRSRDERLIAFSNAHLYGWSLTTFPGVSGAETIRHHLVPFQPGEHGSDESGAAEVERVVELILEHAEQRSDESLGVIAMGIRHADRVEEALRRELQERDDLDEFFDENKPERFFIKNLERVQGDQRDAIILTVGYGKTPDGRMQYRFGPLNQEGGERRFNVAVTRAKARMTVVSSFSAADMDPDRCSARGADLLRLYLQYAETAGEKLDRRTMQAPALNPFEIDVRDALERAGIPLRCQLGCSGFRIDFAAKHPTQPGRMVLAIETDGAAYHSSATARDRDRLRQEHLENLGWRFHRIWSQDWFTKRDREIDRAVTAYRDAVRHADKGGATPARTPPLRERVQPPSVPMPARGPRPSVPRYQSIDDYHDRELIDIVRWIESDTKLRTADALLAEVMQDLGFERRGKRIVERITAAISVARIGP